MTTLATIAIDKPLHIEWREANGVAGFDPRSRYVEQFWLPVLGPSATWLLRHFAHQLDRQPDGVDLDLDETARLLGLGDHGGRHGPFMRTLARTIDFRATRVLAPSRLAVRRRLAPLSDYQLARLPTSLRTSHEGFLSQLRANTGNPLEVRGRQLALTLMRLGETEAETMAQLVRLRYDRALAARCVHDAIGVIGSLPAIVSLHRTMTAPDDGERHCGSEAG